MFMRATGGGFALDEMGYALSRLEIEELYDNNRVTNEASNSRRCRRPIDLDHEIVQLTNMRLAPHERLVKVAPGERYLPVSVLKMLAGRECNYSGRGGKFTAADQCHMLSRYLPVNGPWLVDQMPSRAYVSQFSADGSLFCAGFQVLSDSV